MPPDPRPLVIAPGRTIALAWSQRSLYRLGEIQPPLDLADVRAGRGFRFLIGTLWAMLADEADRRRYRTPEDLAQDFSEDTAILAEAWRVMWGLAYDFDPDAATEVDASDHRAEAAAAKADEPTAAEKKSAGGTPSPSPSSNSGSTSASSGPPTPAYLQN